MNEKETEAAPPVKKRYEWIDNARIVAALLIVYAHMPFYFDFPHVNNEAAMNLVKLTTYHGRVPFFLILAGYFLARRITWHKAFDRALWLLIPFAAWNLLWYVFLHLHQPMFQHPLDDVCGILGIGTIFTDNISILGQPARMPIIIVSWFLRDIIVLSLLTPIIARFKKVIFILLVVLTAYNMGSWQSSPAPMSLLSLGTCYYYLLGVCLVDFRIDDAYRIFNKRFTPFVIAGFLAGVAVSLSPALQAMVPPMVTFTGRLFGALMIAHCGVLIENHLPRVSKWLAPCGPACFLVFMIHMPFLLTFRNWIPLWIQESWLVWLVPIPTCALIICIFLLIKRWAPWLMPYLGHMKVPRKV